MKPYGPNTLARLCWLLPARIHNWMYRHLGYRPGMIVFSAEFDRKTGKRRILEAEYIWEPRR